MKAPDLVLAAGYSLEDFATLMRTGKAVGGRELPIMSETARKRYASFTQAEIEALHQYLVLRVQAAR